MAINRRIVVGFSAESDTLDVTLGLPAASYVEEAGNGLCHRFAPAGHRPSGVTIVNFLANWGTQRNEAYARIAEFLSVDAAEVRSATELQLTVFPPLVMTRRLAE